MNQYLAKYFALYKKLVLPGIGSFNTTIKPATLEFVEKTLHAPVHNIIFLQDESVSDQHFISFLTKETSLDQQDANNKFSQFITQLKEKLQAGLPFNLSGIGVLTNNESGYSFTADNLQKFFPGTIAERIIRQNAQHSVRVGEAEKTSTEMQQLLNHETTQDRWWIGAIVLSVIGIAAIMYYYFTR